MTSRVLIRPVAPTDEAAFLAGAQRSRALHRPWIEAPVTPGQFAAYLKRFEPPAHHGFVVVRRDSGEIAGAVHITNIVRGLFRSGYLSYYVFAGFERQGLMTEGLSAVVRHAFAKLRLHRLEANIQPGNTGSIALVRACGFKREGYSPRYLKIGGRWRDHERWAILAD